MSLGRALAAEDERRRREGRPSLQETAARALAEEVWAKRHDDPELAWDLFMGKMPSMPHTGGLFSPASLEKRVGQLLALYRLLDYGTGTRPVAQFGEQIEAFYLELVHIVRDFLLAWSNPELGLFDITRLCRGGLADRHGIARDMGLVLQLMADQPAVPITLEALGHGEDMRSWAAQRQMDRMA